MVEKIRTNQSILEKFESADGHLVSNGDSITTVYHVKSKHVLIQAVGYLKHVLATEMECNVYFRGQSKIYSKLSPTLYRSQDTQKQKSSRDVALKKYIKESDGLILRGVADYAKEPLLQHYGIKTKWLDIVDNIWIALWFACNDCISKGNLDRYLCFQRRQVDAGNLVRSYAYIYLIKAGSTPVLGKVGYFEGCDTRFIDLRVAAPSIFLRPHAQHGLLFTRATHNDHKNTDYSEFVVGILRIELSDALAWLGEGGLLDTHALFPPPIYDFGYMQLLDAAPVGNKLVGGIHVVCA